MTVRERSFCATPYGIRALVGAACEERRIRGARIVARHFDRWLMLGKGARLMLEAHLPRQWHWREQGPRLAPGRESGGFGSSCFCMSHVSGHRTNARQWNLTAGRPYGLCTLATAWKLAKLTVRVSLSVQPNNSNCPNSRLTIQRAWFWSVRQDADEFLNEQTSLGVIRPHRGCAVESRRIVYDT
jgi:hypothetical protein